MVYTMVLTVGVNTSFLHQKSSCTLISISCFLSTNELAHFCMPYFSDRSIHVVIVTRVLFTSTRSVDEHKPPSDLEEFDNFSPDYLPRFINRVNMAPIYILLSNTLSARQSTPNQSKNDQSTSAAVAIAPLSVGIVIFLFLCTFCLRRPSKYLVLQNTAMSGSLANYFPLRRYNNNDGGLVRNDTRNGEDCPPAYTSIPAPPPAYSPTQIPSNHTRTESNVRRERAHAENNTRTSRRENSESREERKHLELVV